MNCIYETDARWWHFAASLTMEKGDSYNANAESYVDSVKGITDKRQRGSMATKTVIITKTKRTGNVNVKKEGFLSRDRNKAGMIALISTTLTKMGCYVVLSSGDADVQIVKNNITIPS
ncbi:hypothetical protein DPMN_044552 [Dreissena polymorpha]|uniref:Uncharacterized protein n=1 Tax=Dreissena polymorpha TaxID=45954 RepID=A0A9D4D4D8_DREPO|nr:hypothetical protein DPMN_044552 [Dreissena polymorpha]